MRPSAALAAAALLACTACSTGSPPNAAPSTSLAPATTAPPRLDAAAVRRALAETRAARTGRYVSTLSTTLRAGTITLTQTGSYDLTRGLGRAETAYDADSPELAEALGLDGTKDLRALTVSARSGSYLQMPGWTGAAHGRWLRFTAADVAKLGVAGVDPAALDPLPPLVAVLRSARDVASPAPAAGVAYVGVPAAEVFRSFPSSSTRRLVDAGVDPNTLTGLVTFEVHLDAGGRLARVVVDADGMFDDAYAQANVAGAAEETTALVSDVRLSDPGKPVSITVPTGRAVMTSAEFEAAG
jgi:hypothetical protein